MDVATVARSYFKNNARGMMVHMLMSCSYDAQMQGKHQGCYTTPGHEFFLPGAHERRFVGLTTTFGHDYINYINYSNHDNYIHFQREDASSSEALT
jgi:hypothetical protein